MPRPTHLTNTTWTLTWRSCCLSSAGTEQSSHLVNSTHVGASRCHHLLQPGGWMETIGPGNHLSAGSEPWDIPMKTQTQHCGLLPAAIQWLVWLFQHESFVSLAATCRGWSCFSWWKGFLPQKSKHYIVILDQDVLPTVHLRDYQHLKALNRFCRLL